jgi:acetylornithine deacetylase/succinyl-diaminopimelate desuccinylase-like protein
VINEGGGLGLKTGRSNLHFCQVAEKGVCWVRITFRGKPGHGSLPHDNNCVVEMAKAVAGLAAFRSPVVITEPAEKFISGMAPEQEYLPTAEFMKLLDPAPADAVISAIPEPVLQQVLNACLRNTFTPTVTRAGSKTNVIPGECICEIDCRMLPGTTPEKTVMTIEQVLAQSGCRNFSVEILHSSIPTASAIDTPLYRLFERILKKYDPRARLIPYMSSGATDSRFFRERGIPAYGMQMESSLASMERMHGHNERIAVQNLVLGIQVLYDALREFCR